jgi:hypothetical protein
MARTELTAAPHQHGPPPRPAAAPPGRRARLLKPVSAAGDARPASLRGAPPLRLPCQGQGAGLAPGHRAWSEGGGQGWRAHRSGKGLRRGASQRGWGGDRLPAMPRLRGHPWDAPVCPLPGKWAPVRGLGRPPPPPPPPRPPPPPPPPPPHPTHPPRRARHGRHPHPPPTCIPAQKPGVASPGSNSSQPPAPQGPAGARGVAGGGPGWVGQAHSVAQGCMGHPGGAAPHPRWHRAPPLARRCQRQGRAADNHPGAPLPPPAPEARPCHARPLGRGLLLACGWAGAAGLGAGRGKAKKACGVREKNMTREGLEPPTSGFGIQRANQLRHQATMCAPGFCQAYVKCKEV